MKLYWDKWLYGLGSAIIGGGSGAVVAGFSAMLLDSEKFNLNSGSGALRMVSMMGLCFAVNGAFSMFYYLKQSPLPTPGDTTFVPKPEAGVPGTVLPPTNETKP